MKLDRVEGKQQNEGKYVFFSRLAYVLKLVWSKLSRCTVQSHCIVQTQKRLSNRAKVFYILDLMKLKQFFKCLISIDVVLYFVCLNLVLHNLHCFLFFHTTIIYFNKMIPNKRGILPFLSLI